MELQDLALPFFVAESCPFLWQNSGSIAQQHFCQTRKHVRGTLLTHLREVMTKGIDHQFQTVRDVQLRKNRAEVVIMPDTVHDLFVCLEETPRVIV